VRGRVLLGVGLIDVAGGFVVCKLSFGFWEAMSWLGLKRC
jgi:hypothetical protein